MDGDGGNPTQYWCHSCRDVTPVGEEFTCENCQGFFIEEIDEANPPDGYRRAQQEEGGGGGGPPDMPHFFGMGGGGALGEGRPDATHLAQIFTNMLEHIVRADGDNEFGEGEEGEGEDEGANHFLEQLLGGMGGPGLLNLLAAGGGMPPIAGANTGDYVFGNQNFPANFAQLLANSESSGPPPAAAEVLKALPLVDVSTKDVDCAVCKDEFDVGSAARQLPCKHLFHSDCVMPWLERHNTCPVCRFELPSDPAYGGTGVGVDNHEHELVLTHMITPWRCDVCNSSGAGHRFRCNSTCDYDHCETCFHLHRTDAGRREARPSGSAGEDGASSAPMEP